jgi:hypothetical protein
MYGELEWREVHRLFDAGIPKSAIARRLGMSRTTVARFLAWPAPPRKRHQYVAHREASASGGRSARQRITVLPPITGPTSPERRGRIVGALSALLLAHMEREARGDESDQKLSPKEVRFPSGGAQFLTSLGALTSRITFV